MLTDDKVKVERSFVITLLGIQDMCDEDTETVVYDEIAFVIGSIRDPYTRGYLTRCLEELSNEYADYKLLTNFISLSKWMVVKECLK